MKLDEFIKLVTIALAIIASLVGGDVRSTGKIEKYDEEFIKMKGELAELKGYMQGLKHAIEHDGE